MTKWNVPAESFFAACLAKKALSDGTWQPTTPLFRSVLWLPRIQVYFPKEPQKLAVEL